MELIEIFRAGTRQDANGNTVTITADDLKTIAANYSTQYHEAPIVIGHPKHDNPAYGWIKGLVAEGEVLKAEPQQVDSEFAELVREGKFKKISAAFYLPNSANNPKPEGFYLRHVGFLGAMPPAVKGLKDPVFADSDTEFVEFSDWANASLWQRLRDFIIEKFSLADADNVLPAWQVQSLQEEAVREEVKQTYDTPPSPIFNEPDNQPKGGIMSEQETQRLAELEAENAQLKAAQAQAQREKMQAENAAFAESLIAEGKLSPKQKDTTLALLNAEHDSAAFSESEFKQRLKTFLTELPKSVEFAEVATKDKVAEPQDESVEYAEGTDPASIEMDKKVRAYMKAHNVSYVEAFNAITQ
ncbi:hypothetical protein [Gallibacterium anatis]|uniref:Peptidase n=1 Tax=Gallibacterium anatis TaxID=750 RepID=A0A0A2XLP9_9PAST|nr:hypothetical protein [Gallibacterium anatis]KGQ31922.1 hypothetical protein JP32_06040 [Gallibacterium anatis]